VLHRNDINLIKLVDYNFLVIYCVISERYIDLEIKINNKNDIQRLLLSLLLLILLSGGICVNPGPGIDHKYNGCEKKFIKNEYKIQCRECNKLFHPIWGSIITN
jgi:hypothetical protein